MVSKVKRNYKAMFCRNCGCRLPEGGRGRRNRLYCSDECRDTINENETRYLDNSAFEDDEARNYVAGLFD